MPTLDLFPKPPRKAPRVLMHVIDAGNSCDADFPMWVKVKCKKCGDEAEYVHQTISEVKRGIACPNCNATGSAQPALADKKLNL